MIWHQMAIVRNAQQNRGKSSFQPQILVLGKNNCAFTVTNMRYRVLWLGNAMIAACTSGRLPIVKALLERGADEKAPFARPYGTCLSTACASGNVDLVKFFIDKGYDGGKNSATGMGVAKYNA